jgi:hypothetical protein
MFVLQSCTDPLYIPPSSSSVTHTTSSDCIYDVGNIKVEEDIDEIENVSVAINKEVDIGIKQDEIVGDRSFPDINAETDEVRYVCVCVCVYVYY